MLTICNWLHASWAAAHYGIVAKVNRFSESTRKNQLNFPKYMSYRTKQYALYNITPLFSVWKQPLKERNAFTPISGSLLQHSCATPMAQLDPNKKTQSAYSNGDHESNSDGIARGRFKKNKIAKQLTEKRLAILICGPTWAWTKDSLIMSQVLWPTAVSYTHLTLPTTSRV